MAFLDGVKGKISMASYSTVQKAKDMSELTRLNMAISESETKIKELYSEIGYKVYSAYKEEPLEAVKDVLADVKCPVIYGVRAGHIGDSMTLPLHARVRIEAVEEYGVQFRAI